MDNNTKKRIYFFDKDEPVNENDIEAIVNEEIFRYLDEGWRITMERPEANTIDGYLCFVGGVICGSKLRKYETQRIAKLLQKLKDKYYP